MTKLIFYGWEVGMDPLLFIKLLNEKTGMRLRDAVEVRTMLSYGKSYEMTFEDEEIADCVYEKSREYKALVRKETL